MAPPGESNDDNAAPPLPPGWSRGFSKSQKRYYYFHEKTKHTQWHFPTRSEAHDPLKAKQRAALNKDRQENRTSSSSSDQQQQQQKRSLPSESGLGTIVGATSAPITSTAKRSRMSGGNSAKKSSAASSTVDDVLALADSTSVAIIVPYRDLHKEQQRAAHLQKFVPHMTKFLGKLQQKGLVSNFHIYIVEQSNDGRKFNRGKLLNIGFDYAKKQKHRNHDVFIFHDVDLLPQDDLGSWYAKFPKTPLHIARVWDRYSNNPKYMGGVVSFSSSDYKRINGYPNTFWGWGGEDDEMQKRCERLHIRWEYPDRGTLVDLEQMDLSEKLNFLRSHKEWKCMVKWEALEEHESTWRTNGLADLKYQMLGTEPLDGNTGHATKLQVDVKLNGNHWANDKCSVDFMGDWNKK